MLYISSIRCLHRALKIKSSTISDCLAVRAGSIGHAPVKEVTRCENRSYKREAWCSHIAYGINIAYILKAYSVHLMVCVI